jgi:SAM-dependent methyltransferase
MSAAELVLTGERTLPGIWHENYWFRRHEVAYRHLMDVARGTVVDLGCGEGFGTALLRTRAARMLAVELEAPVAQHVRTVHGVAVTRADLQRLPVADASADLVVCLQTIEHLHDQPGFVAECARITRPGGLVAVTTPNARTFPRGNPFHTRELDAVELTDLMTPLHVEQSLGVRHGRRLRRWERRHGSLVAALVDRPWTEWDVDLCDLVRSVTATDFTVGPADPLDLDLLVVARRMPTRR